MKKLLLFLMAFVVISCGSEKIAIDDTENYGGRMKNIYEKVFTAEQFDSICKADKLPTDMAKWISTAFKNYETNSNIVEYLYIQNLGKNEVIYRTEKYPDTKFKITKRVIAE